MHLAALAAARRPLMAGLRADVRRPPARPPAPLAQGWPYNYKVEPNEDDIMVWGSFTQMVWKSTKRVGCAAQACGQGKWAYQSVVCRYDPPGNIAGQYVANVLAP
jgi:hypothetical protein